MIICISANPAIDRRLRIKNLNIGEVNRVLSVESFAGGKAAHVAMAARTLGEEVIWIGFLGGANGLEIERQLKALDIKVIAVETKSATRTNDEIIDESGQITEILEPGGAISETETEKMFEICRETFKKYAAHFTVAMSGSLPPNVPTDFYKKLILAAREFGGKSILDTSGEAFLKGLEANPDLIKPNAHEAENVLNLKIENTETAHAAVKRLAEAGAKNVVISLGADGLIWVGEKDLPILAKPPKVKVISTVGCGDSSVAGLAVALQRDLGTFQKLRLAVACGAANCLANLPGQIKLADVENLLPLVEISEPPLAARDFT